MYFPRCNLRLNSFNHVSTLHLLVTTVALLQLLSLMRLLALFRLFAVSSRATVSCSSPSATTTRTVEERIEALISMLALLQRTVNDTTDRGKDATTFHLADGTRHRLHTVSATDQVTQKSRASELFRRTARACCPMPVPTGKKKIVNTGDIRTTEQLTLHSTTYRF